MAQPKMAKSWRLWLGMAVAMLLLTAALYFALRDADFSTIQPASFGLLVGVAGLVLLNILLNGGLQWIITRSFDADPPVGFWRMQQLIAASGLLNYVPAVRPGLWGRAAYLKWRHKLPVRQAVLIVGLTIGLTGIISGMALTAWALGGLAMVWPLTVAAAFVLAGVSHWVWPWLLKRPVEAGWSWLLLRLADSLAMAGRLCLAFAVVGQPLSFNEALLAAAAAMAVRVLGLTPNGLGLSEWAIAGLVTLSQPVAVETATAAALVDRAVEVLVQAMVGGVALLRLGWTGQPAESS